jgi:hypothetical protein
MSAADTPDPRPVSPHSGLTLAEARRLFHRHGEPEPGCEGCERMSLLVDAARAAPVGEGDMCGCEYRPVSPPSELTAIREAICIVAETPTLGLADALTFRAQVLERLEGLAASPAAPRADAGLTLLEDVAVQPDDGPRDGLNKGTRVYLAPAAPAGLDVALHENFCMELGFGDGHYDNDHAGSSTCAERAVRVLAALDAAGLPDTLGVGNWPGGGGRVSKYDDTTWVNDSGGAWVLLYAPDQFYDGLRLRAASQPSEDGAAQEKGEVGRG